ncbi:SOS response-associated peptidase [Methylopila henanensis]|uniref:Abasic site processing protein n=1 Tax=Methylopila henanensis TaxID=873516 RepID=A0ABW4K7B7_9HYPH
MCGRYAQTTDVKALEALLGAVAVADIAPRFNIAPTQPAAVVLIEDGERRIALHRWGLVPGYASDERSTPLLFNARAETLAQKPAFRSALQRRRCLAPADGWYEWRSVGRFKQPYLVRRRDRAPFMFAGLWESWTSPEGAQLRSMTIVTVTANQDLAAIHERMPAVLPPEAWDAWLDTRVDGRSLALRGLHPAPVGDFEMVAIGARVNQTSNDDPQVQEPVQEPAEPLELAQPRLI